MKHKSLDSSVRWLKHHPVGLNAEHGTLRAGAHQSVLY